MDAIQELLVILEKGHKTVKQHGDVLDELVSLNDAFLIEVDTFRKQLEIFRAISQEHATIASELSETRAQLYNNRLEAKNLKKKNTHNNAGVGFAIDPGRTHRYIFRSPVIDWAFILF